MFLDFLWYVGARWILQFSFGFLFGLGLVGFYGFPLVSFVFLWFCLVSKGETKGKKIQENDKATKESLRRL